MTQGKARRGAVDILMYHAVTEGSPPLNDWCYLPAQQFDAHMATLRRLGLKVVPLSEAVARLQDGSLNERVVAITFDDGYANNATTALPILERYELPATIFLVSGILGTSRSIWASRIIRAVQACTRSEISFNGETFVLEGPKEKARASSALQNIVKATSGASPDTAAEAVEIACDAEVNPDFRGTDFAIMDAEMVKSAEAGGLIEFGAHTVSHPILSSLDDAALAAELGPSIEAVSALVNRPSPVFAYPNGRLQDFDDRAIAILRAHGVTAAVATTEERNRPGADAFRLHRWGIGRNCSALRLAATLMGARNLPLVRRLAG
ncbi:MAG: polysaccharide deacetylase family protein [Pseudomonadota bacterium]